MIYDVNQPKLDFWVNIGILSRKISAVKGFSLNFTELIWFSLKVDQHRKADLKSDLSMALT